MLYTWELTSTKAYVFALPLGIEHTARRGRGIYPGWYPVNTLSTPRPAPGILGEGVSAASSPLTWRPGFRFPALRNGDGEAIGSFWKFGAQIEVHGVGTPSRLNHGLEAGAVAADDTDGGEELGLFTELQPRARRVHA